MRPSRLEMQGFASFREPTVVDFDGSDLFVLTGPTGAGKSTVIDAMVFALYGSVPRYDDRRLVAPVITQGHQEARVRLTFTVGERTWTATRVVRRTKTGATTKEARLERIGPDGQPETVAGSADELTMAVERLLGLSFDHFVRTVVLPQGDFQEFLHARPKDRQDLLVELLDLDVYRRVAARARERATAATSKAEVLQARLDGELAGATEDALAAAKERLEEVAALDELVTDALPGLAELTEAGSEARRRAKEATERAALVADLAPPDGVGELVEQSAQAASAHEQARTDAAEAEAAREAAEQARAELPERARLEHLTTLLGRVTTSAQTVEQATTALESARREQASAAEAADTAGQRVEEAVTAERRIEHQHLAHTIAADLAAGDDCPVCGHTLTAAPDLPAPADLDAATRAREGAEAEARAAADRRDDAGRAVTTAETNLSHATEQAEQVAAEVAALARELEVEAAHDAVATRLAAVDAADRELADARQSAKSAREAVVVAEKAAAEALRQLEQAWAAYDEARDRVAPLEPPPTDRSDLAAAWSALTAWAGARRPELAREAEEAERQITAATDAYRAEVERLRHAADEAGVEVAGPKIEEIQRAVVAAGEAARMHHERLQEQLSEAARVREEVQELERARALAHELGRLLDAKHFEQWLLNRALKRLVRGASRILRDDLSNGAYSLDVGDDSQFLVVDHRDADEVRSARTLSGGETFLASLALALALADDVAELAAGGAARLDALFLDEGFGTLDADTLDTVAAAIEELGAGGRMVGLITHVRELAERMPVRYEVRRAARTSTIEKVVA